MTTNDQMHASTPDELIVTIPWDKLHDSPLQYRKTYSEATIGEIAASIRDTGRIHQPLVVRRHFPNPLFRDQYDPQDGFEIVFGHTRKRGGMAAGLAGAPCVVRDLNDAQVRAAQAAENIARADVHPIEEAEGFRAMIDEDGVSADELAEQLGKSRSYVYGRLKLLALCPDVRRAVLADEIGVEVGLLIARVGGPKMQAKALGYIKAKYYSLDDGGKRSFRNIRDLLNERFTLSLKDAIFDVDDEMLLPSAGYCGRCPKRSGNAPEFADVAEGKMAAHYTRLHTGADVCTDPDCFDAKRKAHLAREAAKLEASGKTVVTGNKARAALSASGEVKGDYIEASKVREVLKNAKAAASKGATMPQVVLLQDQRTGKTVQAVKRNDLQQLGAKLPAAPTARGHDSPEQREQRRAEHEAEQAKLASANDQRRQLLDRVREATRATPRSEFDLRLVARVALAGVQHMDRTLLGELWNCSSHELEARIDRLDLADVGQFMIDCALVADVRVTHVYYLRDKPEQLMAAAEHYGIDTGKSASKAAPTPSSAGASAKKARAGAGAKPGARGTGKAAGQDQGAGAAGEEAASRPVQMDGAGVAGGTATAGAQFDAFAGEAA